jgi:hypothetical protein
LFGRILAWLSPCEPPDPTLYTSSKRKRQTPQEKIAPFSPSQTFIADKWRAEQLVMNPLNVITCGLENLGLIIKEGCHQSRIKGLSSTAAAALGCRVKDEGVVFGLS